MAKQNKRIDIFEGRTKEYNDDYDYYNRPSIGTSYTIAVISLVVLAGLFVLLVLLK